VNKACSTGTFLDKKYTRQNAVQVMYEGEYKRRTHFYNLFLQAFYDGGLDPKLTFFTDEV
jgi:hypothetical protein